MAPQPGPPAKPVAYPETCHMDGVTARAHSHGPAGHGSEPDSVVAVPVVMLYEPVPPRLAISPKFRVRPPPTVTVAETL